MKNRVVGVLASLLLGVLAPGSTVQAQQAEPTIKANIPFDFVVGDEIFPPGRYSVVQAGPVWLELHDAQGRTLTKLLTNSVETSAQADRSKLRFESEGGRHVLTEVRQEGDSVGQQILGSKSPGLAVRKHTGRVQTAKAGSPR